METSCSYTDKWAWFSSDERKWATRIKRLAEKHPDEITIIRMPEENDGCIYAKLPASWLKIQRPIQLNLTDEEKLERVARMKNSQKNAQEAGV